MYEGTSIPVSERPAGNNAGSETLLSIKLNCCPKCRGAMAVKIDSGCPVAWCINCGLTRWF